MDEKQLDYFKIKLLQKQLSLMDMVQRTEGYGREKDRNSMDIGDMAVQSYTKEFLFGKSNEDRKILQMIVEALYRIENETFRYCTHCDNPIHPKRLEAVPWAGYCIECQGLMEKGLLE